MGAGCEGPNGQDEVSVSLGDTLEVAGAPGSVWRETGPSGEAGEASSRKSREGRENSQGRQGTGRGRAGGGALSSCMDSRSATV